MRHRHVRVLLTAAAALAVAITPGVRADDAREHNHFSFSMGTGGAFLGVQISELSAERRDDLGRSGVHVDATLDGTPAAESGLESGDVIVRFDGLDVRSVRQFRRIVGETPTGVPIEVEVERDGAEMTFDVELTSREGRWNLGDVEALVRPYADRLDKSGNLLRFDELPQLRELPKKLEDLRSKKHDGLHYFHRPGGEGNSWFGLSSDRPKLGVEVQSLNAQLREYFGVDSGVLVTRVLDDSLAERAGVAAGDVIVAAGAERIGTIEELRAAVEASQGELDLSVVRRGHELDLRVETDRRETSEADGPTTLGNL